MLRLSSIGRKYLYHGTSAKNALNIICSVKTRPVRISAAPNKNTADVYSDNLDDGVVIEIKQNDQLLSELIQHQRITLTSSTEIRIIAKGKR